MNHRLLILSHTQRRPSHCRRTAIVKFSYLFLLLAGTLLLVALGMKAIWAPVMRGLKREKKKSTQKHIRSNIGHVIIALLITLFMLATAYVFVVIGVAIGVGTGQVPGLLFR